jgi:hypothetical protein
MSYTNNLIESIELVQNNEYFIIYFKEILYSDFKQNNFLNINNFQLKLSSGNAKLIRSIPDLIFKNDNYYVVLFSLNGETNGKEILEIKFNDVYNSNGYLIDIDQKGNYIQLNQNKNKNINKKNKFNILQSLNPPKQNKNKPIQKPIQKPINHYHVPNYYQTFYQNLFDNNKENKTKTKSKYSSLKNNEKISKDFSIDDYLREFEQEKKENDKNTSKEKSFKSGTCYAHMTIIQSNPGLAYKLNLIKYNAYVASLYPNFYGNTPKKYPPQYYMSAYDRIFNPTKEVKPLT